MNSNGLLSCRDVAATGAVASNFYVRKGDPITMKSPLVIVSPNGADTATISEANGGVLSVAAPNNIVLECEGAVVMNPGEGESVVINGQAGNEAPVGLVMINSQAPAEQAEVAADATGSLLLSSSLGSVVAKGIVSVVPQTEDTNAALQIRNGFNSTAPAMYKVWNPTVTAAGLTAGQLSLFGYAPDPHRILQIVPDGSAVSVGDDGTVGGAVLEIAGDQGMSRVYDALYNPPPASGTGAVIVALAGNFAYSDGVITTFTVPKTGSYMLQVELIQGSGAGALNLNGALETQGVRMLLQNNTAIPPALLPETSMVATYGQVTAFADVGPGDYGSLTLNKVVQLAAATTYAWVWGSDGAPTGGVVRLNVYQLC